MQNQMEEGYSRSELIRQARESFHQQTEYGATPRRKDIMTRETTGTEPVYKWKSLMIRTVISAILFLSIFMVKQMAVSYNGLKSDVIKEVIETNQTVESIQESAADFAAEKILPIFRGLW